MATYGQWRTAIDKGQLRRVTWVCGPETVLVEDVVDRTRRELATKELETVSFSAGVDSDAGIWEAVNQYSLNPDGNRLVVVRSAQLISNWLPLKSWLAAIRTMSNTYLLFVSDEPDFTRALNLDGTPSKDWALHLVWLKERRDVVVRCMPFQDDGAALWVKTLTGCSLTSARHLMERTGGDLQIAYNVVRKANAISAELDDKLIDVLVSERVADEFEDALISGNKAKAFKVIERVEQSEISMILGRLDSRLDFLEKLHDALRRKQTLADIGREQVLPIFLARKYIGHAKLYDSRKVSRARTALYVADSPVQRGVAEGALETLTALW